MHDNEHPTASAPDGFTPGDGPPASARKPGGLRRSAKTLAAGAVLVGVTAGAVLVGPMSVFAASPAPSASTAPRTAPGTSTTPAHHCDGDHAPNSGSSGSSSGSSSSSGA